MRPQSAGTKSASRTTLGTTLVNRRNNKAPVTHGGFPFWDHLAPDFFISVLRPKNLPSFVCGACHLLPPPMARACGLAGSGS
jgi:hypothetical protein